jgi:hypothetical protein
MVNDLLEAYAEVLEAMKRSSARSSPSDVTVEMGGPISRTVLFPPSVRLAS